MTSITYIITGAGRGLGLAFTQALLGRPNATIYAGVRSLTSPSAELTALAKEHKNVHVVQLASGSVEDVKNLATKIGMISGKLSVIANAGIATGYASAENTTFESIRENIEVNTFGPITLFQGLAPLLKESSEAKFIAISSGAGSITVASTTEMPTLAYGLSKAALNYAVAKIAQEHPKITAIAIHPGFVQTDMGNLGARSMGMEQAPQTLKESVEGTIKVIDGATIEKTAQFLDYTGKVLPW